MGYLEIKSSLIAVGRVVSQSLLRQIRANFESHELRLSDIETNKTTVPTGLVFEFAGDVSPAGFLLCDGSEVSRTQFASLFAIVGTAYGTPSNSSVFKLPDCRGRVLVGSSGSLSIGDVDGEEEHTLTTAENATHNHPVTDPGHTHGGVFASSGGQSWLHRINAGATAINAGAFYGSISTDSSTTGITLANAGGGSGHNNLQPSVVTNYIIKT